MALTTEQEYKDFADITSTKPTPKLAGLIAAVSAAIEGYIGYSLGTDDQTNRILTRQERTVYMIDSINSSIDSITYQNTIPNAPAARTLEATDYFWDADTGTLTILNPMNLGGSGIPLMENGILTITFDQNTDTVPEDVKLAANLLVQFYYKGEYNRESVAANGQSVQYQVGRNFPPHVSALLNLHRIL